MSSREDEFAVDLQELSKQPEFNSIGFESIIDKIRAHAAEVTFLKKTVVFVLCFTFHIVSTEDCFVITVS